MKGNCRQGCDPKTGGGVEKKTYRDVQVERCLQIKRGRVKKSRQGRKTTCQTDRTHRQSRFSCSQENRLAVPGDCRKEKNLSSINFGKSNASREERRVEDLWAHQEGASGRTLERTSRGGGGVRTDRTPKKHKVKEIPRSNKHGKKAVVHRRCPY